MKNFGTFIAFALTNSDSHRASQSNKPRSPGYKVGSKFTIKIAFTCCEHFILERFPISQVMKICSAGAIGAVTFLTVNIPR